MFNAGAVHFSQLLLVVGATHIHMQPSWNSGQTKRVPERDWAYAQI